MDTAVQRDYYRETGTVKKRIENYWNGRSESFMEQREEELHSGQHQIWAEKYGIRAEFYQMDAEKPEFPDETFDVIVSRNLTWTLPHPAEAYEQWLRVLKPGGILLNYDAEHARYHMSSGLEGEEAHRMLSQGQMDECMRIYHLLPVSSWKRPDWDVFFLKQAGCAEVTADTRIGKRLFPHEDQFRTPYPVFRIKAVKGGESD